MIKSLSSYIIPIKKVNNRFKAIVLEYPNGYGFIGGRLEGNETVLESLKREIVEELGENCPLLDMRFIEIANKYSFDIKKDSNRNRGGADIEEQTFFYTILEKDVLLEFIEECKTAKVVEVDLKKLATKEFLSFESFISYAKDNLVNIGD